MDNDGSCASFKLMSRCILHLDIDCFYCQCEVLNSESTRGGGKLSRDSPIAIRQKHIVVTCNYPARLLGVRKLMFIEDAIRLVPSLVIRDGSDLTLYRRYSRQIYAVFREATRDICGAKRKLCAAKRGGMDEMFADITAAVTVEMTNVSDAENKELHSHATNHGIFIYGEDESSVAVSISEDQSGAVARIDSLYSVPSRGGSNFGLSSALHPQPLVDHERTECIWGTTLEREGCARRLIRAAQLGARIKHLVHEKTGFTTCLGVSVSPMLAKLASELQKPDSVNILYPWRSHAIIPQMPLRKVPGLGSKTLEALDGCLRDNMVTGCEHAEGSFWTCSDLLRVPRNIVVSCLPGPSSEAQADLLLERCQGVDNSEICDDDGKLPKTVSVENSFRRGTIVDSNGLNDALGVLCSRLPKLLSERKSGSESPDLAYPSTVRVTMRNIAGERRIVKTKQCSLNGKALLETIGDEEKARFLGRVVLPIAAYLMRCFSVGELNITRMNVAATGFADLNNMGMAGRGISTVTRYFSPTSKCPERKATTLCQKDLRCDRAGSILATSLSSPTSIAQPRKHCVSRIDGKNKSGQQHISNDNKCEEKFLQSKGSSHIKSSVTSEESRANKKSQHKPMEIPSDFDPNVFAELPSDIQAEIIHYHRHLERKQNSGGGVRTLQESPKKHVKDILHYFGRS